MRPTRDSAGSGSNETYSQRLLREMQQRNDIMPLWAPVLVEAGRHLIEQGLATRVHYDPRTYAKPPKLTIQITDAGLQVRMREPRI